MVASALVVLCYSVIMCIGVPGNVLVIVTIANRRQFHTVRYLLLASLSLSDLLYELLVTLFRTISAGQQQWTFGTVWCNMNALLATSFLFTTTLHLCAITWECHSAVTRPLIYREMITVRKIVELLLLWIVPLLFALASFLGWGTFTYNDEYKRCENPWRFGNTSNITRLVAAIVFFHILPFGIMAKQQLKIRRIAKYQTMRIAKQQQSIQDGARVEKQDRLQKELKASNDALIILGAFLLCYLPMYGAGVCRMLFPKTAATSVAWFISSCLLQAGTCCNPLIYCVRKKRFRREMFRFFKCKARRITPS